MSMREIGRIARLQMQTSSLKVGPPRGKRYDPAGIVAVESFWVEPDGVFVRKGGQPLLDVHHARHPHSKNRSGINGLSVGFTSHYARMRARFGEHLCNGIAGESVLVETEAPVSLAEIEGGLLIEGDDGRRIELRSISVAHPCVEFSRFALDDLEADPRLVSDVLRFLDDGLRGFYACVEHPEPQRVAVGDRLLALD